MTGYFLRIVFPIAQVVIYGVVLEEPAFMGVFGIGKYIFDLGTCRFGIYYFPFAGIYSFIERR